MCVLQYLDSSYSITLSFNICGLDTTGDVMIWKRPNLLKLETRILFGDKIKKAKSFNHN